jgi:hypothetical protein
MRKKRGGKKSLVGLNSRVRKYQGSQQYKQSTGRQTDSVMGGGHGMIQRGWNPWRE